MFGPADGAKDWTRHWRQTSIVVDHGVSSGSLEKKEASASIRDNGNDEGKTQEGDMEDPPESSASSEPKGSAPSEILDDEPKKEDPSGASSSTPPSRDLPKTEAVRCSPVRPPPTLEDIQRDFQATETVTTATSSMARRRRATWQEETASKERGAPPKWALFGSAVLI